MGIGRWLPLALGAALALGAQDQERSPPNNFEFAPEIAADRAPDASAGGRVVAISELLRISLKDENAACAAVILTPDAPLAKPVKVVCEEGGGLRVPAAGRWRLTTSEPPPAPFAAHYERVEVAFTLSDKGISPAGIDDRSRFKKADHSFCLRLAETDGGPSLSGLRVRLHQRYRIVGEGLTDERGKFCADHLDAWPVIASVNGGADFRDAAATFPADRAEGTIELAREERVSCRIADPDGFLHAHRGARFAIRSREPHPETALSPGPPVAWNFWGDLRRDTVSFGILPGDLPPDDGGPWPPPAAKPPPAQAPGERAKPGDDAQPPATEPEAAASDEADAPEAPEISPGRNNPPAPDAEKNAPPLPPPVSALDDPERMEIFLVEDEHAPPLARFTISPRALRHGCVLPLPKPAKRTVRVTVACPAGKVLLPHFLLALTTHRKAVAPGEASSELFAVADGPGEAPTRDRRFTLTLPSSEDYRFKFGSEPAQGEPLRFSDTGEARVDLSAVPCLEQAFAARIMEIPKQSRRETAAPPPAPPSGAAGLKNPCLNGLPITFAEHEALQREDDSLSCDALEELQVRERGEPIEGTVVD